MRAATANRVLWWIVGVMAAFALVLFLTGDAEADELLRSTVVVAATVGFLSWAGYRYRVLPRRASFEGQARDHGLRPVTGDPFGLLARGFALFRRPASVREIENTATGVRGGIDIVLADYWDAPTSAPEYDDYRRYVCVMTGCPAWPDVSVMPEGFVSRLRSVAAMPDILTELEAFNRSFEVRSLDRRFALALLDQRMMGWLLEQLPGTGFEILDGSLMMFRPRIPTSIDDVSRALELLDGFMAHVPRVVGWTPLPGAPGPT
jgi:hypothetical protein